MKMPNLSACAGSCFLVESHVAIEATIEKRPAASEACDSSLRFPLSSDVFILIFQRSVWCLSVLEPAPDVGRSIYFLSFEKLGISPATFLDGTHDQVAILLRTDRV
jgi:hypothetical protein